MKWLNSRHNLKVKPIDFADRFKEGIREGKVKDNAKILGLSNWKDGVAIHSEWKPVSEVRFFFILDCGCADESRVLGAQFWVC